MTALRPTRGEARLKKIEHRQVAQSKAMNGSDGVLARLEIAEAKVNALSDQITLLGGRLAALEDPNR